MQKITPCLWFNDNAEEAANFYTAIFPNSKLTHISRNGDNGPGPKGSALMVSFQIEGQEFMALNGGPQYSFTPAISLVVDCKDQQELDNYWEKLSEGGEKNVCGWLKDKYGLSWQIVPSILGQLMSDKDPSRSARVLQALMQMTKLDIARLQQAYDAA